MAQADYFPAKIESKTRVIIRTEILQKIQAFGVNIRAHLWKARFPVCLKKGLQGFSRRF